MQQHKGFIFSIGHFFRGILPKPQLLRFSGEINSQAGEKTAPEKYWTEGLSKDIY